MDIIQLNINNLISLWKTVCNPFNSYNETGNIHYCLIPNAKWPNRIWTTDELTDDQLLKIAEIITLNETELTFSYFDKIVNGQENSFAISHNFKSKSIQYGMSLHLTRLFKTSMNLTFKNVKNEKDSKIWCEAFELAFGYKISEETVNKSYSKINYTIVLHENEVVGTVILYLTNHIAGIHSLGIIPEMRGKGYAQEIMYSVLNNSLNSGALFATLQASEMARNMYQKMGFSTQFIMRNFQL